MRRTVFLFAFGALVAVACANSTVPDSTGTIVKSDASAADTGSGYDAGYGPTEDAGTTEDTGAKVTDAGKKETSTVTDAAVQDTGSTASGDCDPNDSSYDTKFFALVLSGATPVDCATGCQSTECCYTAAQVCLPQ